VDTITNAYLLISTLQAVTCDALMLGLIRQMSKLMSQQML